MTTKINQGESNNFSLKFALTTLGIFLIYFSIAQYYVRQHCAEIEKNGKTFVAQFYLYKSYPKTHRFYFGFFDNSVKRSCYIREAPKDFYKNVGKFYHVKFLRKYPDLIMVDYREIKDTIEINSGGFRVGENTFSN